ncbi:MAG: AMP-binding protein [Deltaproteobacteria bacterium]|nr:AMP-binding protein [Deltaproteobacteria bacterium]
MPSDYLRNRTVGGALEECARLWPRREALVYPGPDKRYTWAELNAEADRLARGLMALGVGKGDRLALWAGNVPRWLTVMYAAAKIGAVLVTANTFYRQKEIHYLLEQSRANFLVLMEGFRGYSYVESIKNIVPELAAGGRGDLASAALPHLRKIVFLGSPPGPGFHGYEETLALGEGVPEADFAARRAALDPDDVINMQYTSGTTGFPKGVMLTHQNIVTNGYWIGRRQNLTEADRICLPVPLFHCFGLVLGAMAALNHGSAMVVLDVNSPLDILVSIEREKCTAIYGVPTVFISLLEQKSFSRFDLSSLRTGIMAGAPCPVSTMNQVIGRMGVRDITICYGLTETSPVVAQTTPEDSLAKRTRTVGRPLPGVEIKLVDPETGEEVPPGAIGEVRVRGYVTMKGYFRMPEATRETIDPQGWLRTGDLGRLDEDGCLVVTGRWKDMIIRAGENIYPQEVEEYLRQMPGVSDAQVVGVPSKLHGEELGAFLLVREGGPDLTAKDVKAYLRPLISGYKIPRHVKTLSHYPMTASGKIQKFKLREMAADLWKRK